MKRAIVVGNGNKRPGSVVARMRILDEQGVPRDEIRSRLIGEGASAETVDTYIKDYFADSEEARREAGARACALHLMDLRRAYREHSLAKALGHVIVVARSVEDVRSAFRDLGVDVREARANASEAAA